MLTFCSCLWFSWYREKTDVFTETNEKQHADIDSLMVLTDADAGDYRQK